MSDRPKFLKIIWKSGKPSAWMTDGPLTTQYSMSAYDCENSIASWERLLESKNLGIKNNQSEAQRIKSGIHQFQVALNAIHEAGKIDPSQSGIKFFARAGLQGFPNPLSYIEVTDRKIRYFTNGSKNFELNLDSVTATFKPKGFSQILGYGSVTLNADGRSYEVQNLNNGRGLRKYIEDCQRTNR